jgi:hypothetical protein
MHLTVALLALTAVPPDLSIDPAEVQHFTSYTRAHEAARRLHKPMLVILNPPAASDREPISMEALRKTRHRRELLEDYVVAVLDTDTRHGKVCYDLFRRPELPRVVVIDKDQKYQIFKTSDSLYGQLWTTILEKHREGERVSAAPVAAQHLGAYPPSFGYPQPGFSPSSPMFQQPAHALQSFCPT